MIIRIPKIRNYTVMSNHHLTDPELSLKAKGLLSYMLSRPDDWDFTIDGLARLNREGADAIGRIIRELEAAGYVTRRRVRNRAGRFADMEYRILECPRNAGEAELPRCDKDGPCSGDPGQEHPDQERPAQDPPETGVSCPDSAGQPGTGPSGTERKNTDPSDPDGPVPELRTLRAQVRSQIDYYELLDMYGREDMDSIVSLIVEVLASRRKHFTIAGGQLPSGLVRDRFRSLDSHHIQYVLGCMRKTGSDIRNIKQYLLTALFNAPATQGSYYRAMVNRDRLQA